MHSQTKTEHFWNTKYRKVFTDLEEAAKLKSTKFFKVEKGIKGSNKLLLRGKALNIKIL